MDPNIYAMVLDTLNRATSQDAQVLKPAEKKLQEWEIEPGFYSVLLDILSNHSINVNVRWLAVMCFKNGVDRYWRKTAPNAITEEEKEKLKIGLMTANILNEPVAQIATQQAVLISKIARFDCPRFWPNLVPELLSALKAPQSLVQHRSLLIFHHVVKALASKRISSDRKIFEEFTQSVYNFILTLWHEHTELFLRHIQESAATEVITDHLEKALLCLRILRKMTVFGFKKPHDSPDVMVFLNVIFDRAKTSLECRKLLKGRGIYLLELCEKFIIHLTKVALGVLDFHPFSYVPLIRPSLEFTIYFCFTEQGMALLYERFTIQCLNILKGILDCVEYKMNTYSAKDANALTLEAHQLKLSVLDDNTVRHMCRHLVTRYLLLSSDELALWDAEPESFATDEAGDSWKYSLRPGTEGTFMELFHEFRELLAPELVQLLGSQQKPPPPHDLPAILLRDAIYNAVARAAIDLYDFIDFDEWFTNILSQELKIHDDNYRIIRRRVCQVISQWVGVRASQSIRPTLYAALLEILTRPSEDVAVKISAAEAFRCLIEDFFFDAEQFAPYATHVMSALYDLLVESEECDTKMHILDVISFVAERCGAEASQAGQLEALFSYLPQLWNRAETHNMLRAAVLSTVVNWLKAMGELSPTFRPWVLSVVVEATCLTEPMHVYLLEDALVLWLAILETSNEADAPLLQLAANLPPILEQSSEHLRTVVYIMQAYTVLAPEQFLAGSGAECVSVLASMLTDMRAEGFLIVLKMAEVCVSVSFPERNAFLGVKVIWNILIKVIHSLLDGEGLSMIMAVRLSLLSRVILISPELFYKAIEESAQGLVEYECDPVKVLDRVLLVWTDKMNLVSQVERCKLLALALAALLTSQNSTVLQRFSSLMLNITEVLNDVMKTDETGAYVDGVVGSPAESRAGSPGVLPPAGAESLVATRALAAAWRARRAAAALHPARRTPLHHALHAQLGILKNQVGAETFDHLIQSMEAETLRQLREYIPL